MNRRSLLKNSLVTLGTGFVLTKVAQAQNICAPHLTPRQTKGPFYPVVDQLDTDADLIQVTGKNGVALGEVVMIEGQVSDQFCAPVAGALVEIWQACESGRYDHPSDPNRAPLDPNFQYWGKAVTDQKGNYRFRTIIPGAYPADTNWMRPPHIHFKVSQRGYQELITQMYFAGQELNGQDLILQDLSPEDQASVVVSLVPRTGLPHPVGLFNIQMKKITNTRKVSL